MPSPASTTELIDLMRRSGVMKDDSIEERIGTLDGLPKDPIQSAAVLVQKGVLTRFQAKLLLAGRHRGFKLGAYVIKEQIGQGGMGAVYLAEHETLRRKVALKVLAPAKDDGNAKLAVERFLREARAAAALDHPNIVRIHDVAKEGNVHYLVMEYVEGQTLEAMLIAGGPVTPSRAVGYIAQAAAGLQHAHEKGFVHRDIKPANLILGKDGTIKILDMGLARSFTDDGDKLTENLDRGAVVGTADYISPEQAINLPQDIRSDIYSLGATFFALITGRPPFGGNTTQKLIQHQMKDAPFLADLDRTLPKELSGVAAKMMAKKADHRYRTPADVIAALAPWLSDSGGKVVAGISGLDAGSNVNMQNTLNEIVAGSTRRLNKPNIDGNEEPSRKKYYYIGGGLAAAIMIGSAAFLLSGSETPPKNDGPPRTPNPNVAANLPNPTPANNNPSTPAAKSPIPAKAVYSADLADIATFRAEYRGLELHSGTVPSLPLGLNIHCWDSATTGEFRLETVDGKPALALGSRTSPPTAQVIVEPESKTPMSHGRLYTLRFEYRTVNKPGGFVAWQDNQYKIISNSHLLGTDGAWRIASLTVLRPVNTPLRAVIDANEMSTDGWLYLRNIHVTDDTPPAAPASAAKVIASLDLGPVQPFTRKIVGRNNDKSWLDFSTVANEGSGDLPKDWQSMPYIEGAELETSVRIIDGQKRLGIRNTSGSPCGMIFTAPIGFVPGKYRVEIEFCGEGTKKSALSLRYKQSTPTYVAAQDVRVFPATGNIWQTGSAEMDVNAASSGFFEIHNWDFDLNAWLWIRSLRVIQLSGAHEPVAQGTPRELYRMNFAQFGQAEVTKTGSVVNPGKTDVVYPKGIYMHGHKPDTVSAWWFGPVDGSPAVAFTNLSGQKTAQIGLELERSMGIAMSAGKAYRAIVSYRTTGTATGRLYSQTYGTWTNTSSTILNNTNDAWKTAEVNFVHPGAHQRVLVDIDGVGEANRMIVRELVVMEVGGAPSFKPDAPPAANQVGQRIFTFDPEPLRADAKFTFSDGRIADGENFFTGNTGGHCWKKDSTAEFCRRAFDNKAAVGVTNLNDELSSQIHITLESSQTATLTPNREYILRIAYRTANDAEGKVLLREPQYQILAEGTLSPSPGEWKTLDVRFPRKPGKPIDDIVIENTTVGEGNTLYIGTVELFEAK
jgi:eukaryotic-like serine/threonine-protein kinase